MAVVDPSRPVDYPLSVVYPVIDTHTHFDAPIFDEDREEQARKGYAYGVRHLVLVGYLQAHFERLYEVQHALAEMLPANDTPDSQVQAYVALGLHPFYCEQHTEAHLASMAQLLNERRPLAIGEIGLDTYTDAMKDPDMLAKQKHFFTAQLTMAVDHQLPVMLHIRKAHAEALAVLKAHDYDAHQLGGIAHSFSGGEQEAKAFVKLGFKLGVTGQVTNPNAKKLRRTIKAVVERYGIECLVIETDCPDMTPIMCQTKRDDPSALGQSLDDEWRGLATHNRNVPAHLPWVLMSLSELLEIPVALLAKQLWQNSCDALKTTWAYS